MQQKNSSFKKLLTKIKGIKNIEIVIAILIMAVIIAIFTSSINTSSYNINDKHKDQNTTKQTSIENQNTQNPIVEQEVRLQEKLSAIKGAGKVEVMITYKSSKEVITATNTMESNTTTQEEDSNGGNRKVTQSDINSQAVTMNDGNGAKPLIIKELEPEIKGVIVIAEGANDINVKMQLLRAVQTVLGVNADQVDVFVMESK
ncbi:stage III sporulation protein AG [Xylanivirga thermophila]|uniref:stage III sporulation protein AG n=1 Tax=Xylanivirga thermophila TaxID=2496273 RepID=UPI00101DDF1D|nr:stage III sporulation protein AG [Xylanivirga thermophila]